MSMQIGDIIFERPDCLKLYFKYLSKMHLKR